MINARKSPYYEACDRVAINFIKPKPYILRTRIIESRWGVGVASTSEALLYDISLLIRTNLRLKENLRAISPLFDLCKRKILGALASSFIPAFTALSCVAIG